MRGDKVLTNKQRMATIIGLGLSLAAVFSQVLIAGSLSTSNMMLMGGGLNLCRSENVNACVNPLKVRHDGFHGYVYSLSKQQLNSLKKLPWHGDRLRYKNLLIKLSTSVSNDDLMTKNELFNRLRTADIMDSSTLITGNQLLSRLSKLEQKQLLELLQKGENPSGFFASSSRKREIALLSDTKDEFSRDMIQLLSQQVVQHSGSRSPTILLVTAGARDPFHDVDAYQQLLEQSGDNIKVIWLPVDEALNKAMLLNADGNNKAACDDINQIRESKLSIFHRQRVYPDLAKQQYEYCQRPELFQQLIQKSNAILFVSGSAERIKSSFTNNAQQPTAILKQIKNRLNNGSLLIAADGDSIAAMSGSSVFLKKVLEDEKVGMITHGESFEGLTKGVYQNKSITTDCHRSKTCPPGLNTRTLVYDSFGGLDLFNYGVLDAQISELGRQGRLIKVARQLSGRYAFGLDQKTALLVSWPVNNKQQVTMRVMGYQGVNIFDMSEVQGGRKAGFISSILMHYLTHGDTFDYNNDRLSVAFADWKFNKGNYARPVIQSSEVFKKDNFRRVMNMLCRTSSPQANLTDRRLGKAIDIKVKKSNSAVSLSGSRNVLGKNYGYCSYRDYYLNIRPR